MEWRTHELTNSRTHELTDMKAIWLEHFFIHTHSHEHWIVFPQTHELMNSQTHKLTNLPSHELEPTDSRTCSAFWLTKAIWLERYLMHTNSHEHGNAYPWTHKLTNWLSSLAHESYMARALLHAHEPSSKKAACVHSSSPTPLQSLWIFQVTQCVLQCVAVCCSVLRHACILCLLPHYSHYEYSR